MKYENRRRNIVLLTAAVLLPVSAAAIVTVALVGRQSSGSVIVPTGQTITPAGTHIEVNDRPLGIAVSPDGTQAAVATASNFASRALHIIDLIGEVIIQTIGIGNSFVGLAYSPDGNTLYVGGGADNDVKIFTRDAGGQWTQSPRLSIPSSAPSGLSLSPGGDKLYVALNLLGS
jgi:DNA-binding beta-propeller fold protein YncE